ncbi:MAG: hypothetical protein DCO96_15020 [Fluviicola sp. XM-24bin1]|nr:MAG: hypothetical protein DCO96_15020 [Fluviicola sp. XM-24bin1]
MKTNSLKSALLLGALSLTVGANAQEVVPAKRDLHQHNNITYASTIGPDGRIRCHTMEADSIRRANDPSLPTLAQEEEALQREIAKFKAAQLNGEAKKIQYTIPVIFHILTDGSGAENLSAAQIQAQLDQLNLDYADQAGSSYAQSADTEVQFCLAQVDENGTPLAEPGINRITTYGDGPFGNGDYEGTNGIKAQTIWDPNDYFNIWVSDLSGGLLGYAQFPSNSGLGGLNTNGGSANTDGCVILYTSVGSVANPNPQGNPYNRGRTLTHEAGHWLGLRHIWGDSNCGNDFCADTPESSGSNFGCPTQTTCDGQQDMVENYMDYTNDICMNTFTNDQKTRIQTVMSVSPRRSTLGQNNVCNLQTVNDDIGVQAINAPTGTICGESFDPELVVRNYGTNTITSFTLNYDIDGGTNQTENWTGSLGAGQTTTIALPTQTTSNGAHTFNASTSSPNGNNDTNTSNDADAESFTLDGTGSVVTFTLDTDCYGEESVYELYDASNNLLYTGGNQNVTLPVTATQNTATTDPGAYPNETTIEIEWCLTSGECYEFTLWDAYGDGLNGSAVQGCNTDGDYQIEDEFGTVLASMQAPNGTFTFSETANFCLSGVGIDELAGNDFTVFPNPGNGIFNVTMTEAVAGDFTVSVLDVTGRVVMTNVENTDVFTIDMSGAAAGTYTVAIQTANGTMTKRVILK